MNVRRSLIVAVVAVVLTALITGGIVYAWQQGRVASCNRRLESARRESRTDGDIPAAFLAVYGSTADEPDRPIVDCYVDTGRDQPVMQKLRVLADRLSRLKFSGLPIEVSRIDTVTGRRVVVIDLRELHEGYEPPTWRAGYFQGSTGGMITQTTLVHSFLQKDYRGEWVDGVRFLYQGEPIREGDWDHIDLSGVTYR